MMNQESRDKISKRLGLTQDSVFELLHRDDFDSDSAYLDALTKLELERRSPEYREIRRQLAGAYEKYNEEKVRQQQREDYQRFRDTVQLDSLDRKEIDAEARRLAETDVANGKISAGGLGAAIVKHTEALEAKRLDRKAADAQMNAMLRRGGNEQ